MDKLAESQDIDPKVAGSIPLCTTIFLPTIFACWHSSLHLKIHNQNEWSAKKNQVEFTGLRQGLTFSFIVSCVYCILPEDTGLRQGLTVSFFVICVNCIRPVYTGLRQGLTISFFVSCVNCIRQAWRIHLRLPDSMWMGLPMTGTYLLVHLLLA